MTSPFQGQASTAMQKITNNIPWLSICIFYRAMSTARPDVYNISPSGSQISTVPVSFVARVSRSPPWKEQPPLLLFALFPRRGIPPVSVRDLPHLIRSRGSHGCRFQWSINHCDILNRGGPESCSSSACTKNIPPHSSSFTLANSNRASARLVSAKRSLYCGSPVSAMASLPNDTFHPLSSWPLPQGLRENKKGFLLPNYKPKALTRPPPPPPPPMGIRDNGGGGAGGGSDSGGRSGSGENGSVWCGFIVEGYCLVGSVIVSVVVHTIGF